MVERTIVKAENADSRAAFALMRYTHVHFFLNFNAIVEFSSHLTLQIMRF